MSNEKRAFDPTVSFTFFGSWHETVMGVKQTLGDSAALKLYEAIADYSLFGVEPDFTDNPMLGAVAWPLIVREIDSSISKRQAYFANDELPENYKPILDAVIAHPDFSLRRIAELTGKSKDMVRRVKKKYAEDIANDIDYGSAIADDIDYAMDNGNYYGNGIGNDNDKTRQRQDTTRRDSATDSATVWLTATNTEYYDDRDLPY